jgi:hypothetical protein
MDEAEWLTHKKRIVTKLRSSSPQCEIIRYRDDQREVRLAKTRGQVESSRPPFRRRLAMAGQASPAPSPANLSPRIRTMNQRKNW